MDILRISILMKSFTMSSVSTIRSRKMVKRITMYFLKYVEILYKEINRFKRAFSEMFYIKIKKVRIVLYKVSDIKNLNSSYNMLLDFIS